MGERAGLSTQCGLLAHALCALGRHDEAEEWSRRSQDLGAEDDVMTQILWRGARAKVFAHRGELVEADRLAREAVQFAERTDMLNSHADTLVDLAQVLAMAGKDARSELAQAIALYERKSTW